jgi:predicted O-methyltransferase YrrM
MSTISNFIGSDFFFPAAVTPHNDLSTNHFFMMALMAQRAKSHKRVNVLEVGSWCGYSALIWAQAIREYFNGKGMLTCLDIWAPYFSEADKKAHKACKEMDIASGSGAGHETFLHNMRAAQKRFELPINSICGKADHTLPLLQAESFDIVYLDASHAYEPVKRDLPACARLVREGGFLCGDDLELQLHQLDKAGIAAARRKADTESCITDPVSKKPFHPGVTLAVGEYLGRVSRGGYSFWAMQKTKDGFIRIPELKLKKLFKPRHLHARDRYSGYDLLVKRIAANKRDTQWQG